MTSSTTSIPSSEAAAPVMDRLKAQTRADHDATEAIPFSEAMVNRTLPEERYVAQLAAYAVLHEALEDALATADHPTVKSVWREDMRKLPLLKRDLNYFASERPAIEPGEVFRNATQAAAKYAKEIRSLQQNDPVALLGHLYVLEGSTLGGTILRSHIKAAYGLDEDGLAYYSPYGNAVMPHWREFKSRMNESVTDADEQERVVAGARDSFRQIGTILKTLSDGL